MLSGGDYRDRGAPRTLLPKHRPRAGRSAAGLVESPEEHVLGRALGRPDEMDPALAVVGVGVKPDPLQVVGRGEGVGDPLVHDAADWSRSPPT